MSAISSRPPSSAGHAKAHAHGQAHHVAPWQVLLVVLLILLVMTAITVYTAREIHLGEMGNTVLALIIAVFKAALVVGFFMHLHWDNKFNAAVLLYCLLTVGCFLTFTIIDLSSRGLVDPMRAVMIPPKIVAEAREKAIQLGEHVPPLPGQAEGSHALPPPGGNEPTHAAPAPEHATPAAPH